MASNITNFNYYPFKVDQNVTLVEYIWIDGTGENLRSKTKVYDKQINSLGDLDWWAFDGSSTGQAVTNNSEIFLKPVAIYQDPFRGGNHKLCLSETYQSDLKTPATFNFRHICEEVMNEAKDNKPQFGIEQEYFLMQASTNFQWPLGWPLHGYPAPQAKYYCGVGNTNVVARAIAEAHMRLCLQSKLKFGGVNAEVALGQWEYQIGIVEGVAASDELWISRYILDRLGEEFGVTINYHPKPIKGDWNGSGGHVNFSTKQSRQEGGYEFIKKEYIPALDRDHQEMIDLYGSNNNERMTGRHETSSFDKFTWGDGTRGASVRIPIITKTKGRGHLEDRRPGSNLDPYLVTAALISSCCLGGKHISKLREALGTSLKQILH